MLSIPLIWGLCPDRGKLMIRMDQLGWLAGLPQHQAACVTVIQNALGIALAGGLGGYIYLQKKGTAAVQADLDGKISDQRSSLDDLRTQATAPLERLTSLVVPEMVIYFFEAAIAKHACQHILEGS